MDLVVGRGRACLLAMTERKGRKEIIIKLPGKGQKHVIAAMDKLEKRYKGKFRQMFKSITMDNGSEFLDADGIENSCLRPGTKRTECYYAHPYSAWERGSNENANKLIRRLVPKGYDIGELTNVDVKRIENWVNNYPRRMFGYKTANEVYKELSATG
jgi:IS30 family transposase